MAKPIDDLEIEIYDWPDSYLVEAEGADREYHYFFPDVRREVYPHFVDLSVYDFGYCSCRDFRFGVEPFLFLDHHRRECVHLIRARTYRSKFTTRPKPMPDPEHMKALAQFCEDRNKALLSLDEQTIRDHHQKYGGSPLPTNPDVFWGAIHKTITGITSLPLDFRKASKVYLDEHGLQSHDDGDL